MIDILRKTILAGVGASVVTVERIESLLDELVERGELSATEAKNAANRLAAEGKSEMKDMNKRLSSLFDEMLNRAHVATRDDLEALKQRVNALEVKVGITQKTVRAMKAETSTAEDGPKPAQAPKT